MADRIFLRLDDKHALGADELQWILFRAKTAIPIDAPLVLGRDSRWRGVSFVRSTKGILLRCIREAGCKPSRQAQLALDGYPPDTFTAWKRLARPLEMMVPADG